MRIFLMILGTIAILTGGVAFYLGQQNAPEDANQSAIRQALKAQVKAVAADVELGFQKQSQDLEQILTLLNLDKKSRPKNILEAESAPLYLVVKSGAEIREQITKRANLAEDVKNGAESFFGKEDPVTLWEGLDKATYVFLKGNVGTQSYVAVYKQDVLFAKLRGSAAIRPWVALANGTVLFHASARHIGVNSANVRPVAQGAESLRHNQQTEMLANYVGIDGQEILGAWITLPKWGVIVGTEWPTLAASRANISLLTWLAIAGFLLGAFLLGSCITPQPIHVTAAQREIKDLSHEARAFIKKAERQAEKALEFANERDAQCGELEAKAREQLAFAERTRWIFERTESFLEDVVEAKEDHQVWKILADYLSKMAARVPVLVYTYSPSSCSLVPQAQVGTENIPEAARRYLTDARLLVGDANSLHRLDSTSAYSQWRERWERYMPLDGQNLHYLPFASTTGSRGVVFMLFADGIMGAAEIDRQQELWSLFAYRAAWLYDMKKRLLQSKHVQKRTEYMAGSPDRTRDRSPTT